MKNYYSLTFYFLSLLIVSRGTVWDNIFSQLNSPTAIDFQQSFSATIFQPSQQVNIHIDYNHKLQLLTLSVAKPLIITDIEVISIQLDIQTQILSIKPIGSSCQRYKIVQKNHLREEKKSNQFESFSFKPNMLMIAFKFIGLSKNKLVLQELKIDLLDTLPQQFTQRQQQPVVAIDPQSGRIVKIYTDQSLAKQIQFVEKSFIKKPVVCSDNVKQITLQEIQEMIKNAVDVMAEGEDIEDLIPKV